MTSGRVSLPTASQAAADELLPVSGLSQCDRPRCLACRTNPPSDDCAGLLPALGLPKPIVEVVVDEDVKLTQGKLDEASPIPAAGQEDVVAGRGDCRRRRPGLSVARVSGRHPQRQVDAQAPRQPACP
jgi:hypothetical protein